MLAMYHPWYEEERMHFPANVLPGGIIKGGDPLAKQKDLDTYIDLSFQKWRWLSQREFHTWGCKKRRQIRQFKEQGNTQLTKFYEPWYRHETVGYHEATKRLTKEWRVSSPTAVKELGWDPPKRSFIVARGSHDVDDTTQKAFTMRVSTKWVFKNYGEKLATFVQKIGGILSGEEGIALRKFFEVPSDKTGNLLKTDGVVISKYAFRPKDAVAFGSVCSDTTPGT
jgi:hypothetical protein